MQTVKEKLQDMNHLRKAKAEAKDEEKVTKATIWLIWMNFEFICRGSINGRKQALAFGASVRILRIILLNMPSVYFFTEIFR